MQIFEQQLDSLKKKYDKDMDEFMQTFKLLIDKYENINPSDSDTVNDHTIVWKDIVKKHQAISSLERQIFKLEDDINHLKNNIYKPTKLRAKL